MTKLQAEMGDVDQLAQIIRKVDGAHSLGAGALAEAVIGELKRLRAAPPMSGPPGSSDSKRVERASAIKRFEAMFIPEPNSGCWLWEASLAGSLGYGQFYAGGKLYGAHRYSWMIYRGEIPPGIFVCHRCDNPICVNPNHLFLGSPKQNADDMVAKGRQRKKWTHCKRGHAYDEVGVRLTNGRRWCLACARASARQQYERRVARLHELSKGSQP